MKKLLLSAVIGTSMAVILTACVSPKTRQLEQHNQALYDSVKAEVNPNPTQKYDIIIDASDSIEGLVLSKLTVHFYSECRLFLKRIPAVTHIDKPLFYRAVLPFKQIGKQKYQATVYQDWLIDKDYFNQGKNCGWETPNVWFTFESTTNPNATMIDFADIGRDHETGKLLAENTAYQGTFYFSRLFIANANPENRDMVKKIALSPTDKWFGAEHRNHLGRITITAKKQFAKPTTNQTP
ncbi:hypothetical protein [Moraxella oblonga]|uniref:hypothetical protein n=1 Tax=Moraxella oblonga TaxID=200413 RepID=UPI00083127F6|nr:hypothetical protein [Moraxella oblonga]